MAEPVVQTTAVTAFSADQTSHTVNLPASIAAGDLLLLWFSCDGTGVSTTITPPAGWTESSFLSSTDRSMLLSRVADGGEGATVVVTTSDSQSSTSVALRISGATNGFVVGTQEITGTTAWINPPAITPDATCDALFVGFVSVAGTVAGVTAPPGNDGDVFSAGDAASNVSAGAWWAGIGPVVSGSEEPTISANLTSGVLHRQVAVIVQGSVTATGGGPLIGPGRNIR